MQLRPRQFVRQTLFTPADLHPARILLIRAGLVLMLFSGVIGMLWLDRGGLRDSTDGEISFVDVIYFSAVTIMSVGYGDIVPVTPRARLLDALVVTPVRLFIWFLFLGTAYQLIIRQYIEEYRMAKLRASLDQHVIICGFGHTGFAALKELLAKRTVPDQVVVIDPDAGRVQRGIEHGITAISGDATQEGVLKEAVLDKAKAIIITTGRDDTNALILLTARHLNQHLRIIVSAHEEENIKLFRQGGANVILSPSTFGGYLLAAAVDQSHLVQYMEDLLTVGGHVNLTERSVRPEEVGLTASDLRPDVLLRVYRRDKMITLQDLQAGCRLEQGDVLVLLHASPAS